MMKINEAAMYCAQKVDGMDEDFGSKWWFLRTSIACSSVMKLVHELFYSRFVEVYWQFREYKKIGFGQ